MIRVELLKLVRRPRSWVSIGLLCGLPVLVAVFVAVTHVVPPPAVTRRVSSSLRHPAWEFSDYFL